MVSWDGQSRPVDFVGTFPNKGYVDKPYIFLDEKKSEANGVLVEMEPYSSTKILRVVDKQVKFQDIAIKGGGWFLGINPEGNISVIQVNEFLEDKNPLVEYGAGWTFCWLAGGRGLEILDVTEPPFQPAMEEEIPLWSNQLPEEFWENELFYSLPDASAVGAFLKTSIKQLKTGSLERAEKSFEEYLAARGWSLSLDHWQAINIVLKKYGFSLTTSGIILPKQKSDWLTFDRKNLSLAISPLPQPAFPRQ